MLAREGCAHAVRHRASETGSSCVFTSRMSLWTSGASGAQPTHQMLGAEIPGVAPFAIRDVAESLLRALDHIHGFFVAHCDVSARNLCSRLGWRMVLIDFDSAQIHRSLDELSEGQVNLEHFRCQDLSSLHSRNMNGRRRLCGC